MDGYTSEIDRFVFSLRPNENDASLFLDATRAVASQIVVFGHAIGFYGQFAALQLPRLPAMQDVAVAVFFVLSGFLIAFTLNRSVERHGYTFRHFAIERFARIFSAYLPCLVLVAAMDYLVAARNPTFAYQAAMGPTSFLANVAMLQDVQLPWKNQAPWTSFGSDRPLWTLAIEWWIYMFVGAAVLWRRPSWWRIVLILLLAIVPAENLLTGRGAGLFGLWLLGAAGYWLLTQPIFQRVPSWTLASIAVGAGWSWYLVVRAASQQVYQPTAHALLALGFVALIGVTMKSRATVQRLSLQRIVRFFSGYSLTLYLIHYTLIEFTRTYFPGSGVDRWWQVVLGANIIAILVASLTERRYKDLAAWLRDHLPTVRRPSQAAPAT